MNTKVFALVAGLAAVLLAAGGTVLAGDKITIETVPVGNPGNAADTRYATPGYGAVVYEYRIGKYEVTAGQYCEFLNAVATTDTYELYHTKMGSNQYGCKIQRSGSSGSYTYSIAADWANRPVNYVSWGDAARFANWLHNGQPTGAQDLTTTEDGAYYLNGATSDAALLAVGRKADWQWAITSEDEWYKAAYYDPATSSYYDFPTSSNIVPSNDLIDPDPGNNANFYQGNYAIGDPYWRTEVGEFENSESPYGTFDQGGNVWEWNEAVIGTYRGTRGGSWSIGEFQHYGLNNSLRASCRDSTPSAYEHVGFRVVQVPEPATVALLALGGMAVLRRKRT